MTQLLLQVRQRGFISLRCLTSLTSLSLGSDCTNDTLAVVRQNTNQFQVIQSLCSFHFQVGQNCSLLRHLDICSSGAVTEQGAGLVEETQPDLIRLINLT